MATAAMPASRHVTHVGERRVSQKGCAGQTAGEAEERAPLCRQAACKLDAATVRRLAALLADVSDPDRLAEVGDLIIECETAADLLAHVTTGGRFQRWSAGAGGLRAVRSAGASLPGNWRPTARSAGVSLDVVENGHGELCDLDELVDEIVGDLAAVLLQLPVQVGDQQVPIAIPFINVFKPWPLIMWFKNLPFVIQALFDPLPSREIIC